MRTGCQWLVALLLGGFLFWVTLEAGVPISWENGAQTVTIAKLHGVAAEIRVYRTKIHRAPKNLGELNLLSSRLIDGWGRPLSYTSAPGGDRLLSYGRDGRPGGQGLDEDLSPAMRVSHQREMAVSQAIQDPGYRNVIMAAVINTVLGIGLGLWVLKFPDDSDVLEWYGFSLKLVLVTFASVVVAMFILLFHVPMVH